MSKTSKTPEQAADTADSELQDESYIYDWTCPNCGQTGKEYHALVFSEHILT